MSALSFLQTHLLNRNGTYYFRIRIPVDILDAYTPKKEIVFSLKTKDAKLAKERCHLESVRLDQEFTAKRRELEAQRLMLQAAPTALRQQANTSAPTLPLRPFDSVSNEELKRLTLLYAQEEMEADQRDTDSSTAEARQEWEERQSLYAELHANTGLPFTPEPFPETQGMSFAAVERKRQHIQLFLHSAPAFLARHDYAPVLPKIVHYLQKHSIQIPSEDGQIPFKFRTFCLSLMREELKVQTLILQRLNGDWSANISVSNAERSSLNIYSQENIEASTNLFPSEDNPLFSIVWEKYLAERKPSQATIGNFTPAIRRFIELVGDLPMQAITKSHIRKFKDALLETPAHPSGELKNMTFPELLKKVAQNKDAYTYLNPKTINNKNIAAISTVCSHAVSNGYIDSNPCSEIRAKEQGASGGPIVLPYSEEDLNIIFQKSALFTPDHAKGLGKLQPRMKGQIVTDYRWLVLLALYSGARLEELGQLDIADVKEEAGVKYIHIHDDPATGRTVKNRASRRKTPLHPRLLELGFMDFVAQVKATGAIKLFSSFKTGSDGKRTNAFSHWWERFTIELGIKGEDKRKRFHSFRHCFKREMVNTMSVDTKLIDALQGHTVQGVSAQYGRDEDGMQYALPVLLKAISKATFGGVTAGLEEVMKKS